MRGRDREGGGRKLCTCRHPPPQPSPARGEGAGPVFGDYVHDIASKRVRTEESAVFVASRTQNFLSAAGGRNWLVKMSAAFGRFLKS